MICFRHIIVQAEPVYDLKQITLLSEWNKKEAVKAIEQELIIPEAVAKLEHINCTDSYYVVMVLLTVI